MQSGGATCGDLGTWDLEGTFGLAGEVFYIGLGM